MTAITISADALQRQAGPGDEAVPSAGHPPVITAADRMRGVPAHHWRPDPDDEPDYPAPQLLAALAHLGPAEPARAADCRPGLPC